MFLNVMYNLQSCKYVILSKSLHQGNQGALDKMGIFQMSLTKTKT
jgi:hypothetical protein